MSLESISTEDLAKELDRRKLEALKVEQQRKNMRREAIEKFLSRYAIDLFLAPQHTRTSCSDDDLNNSGGGGMRMRCERCFYLMCLESGWPDGFDIYTSVQYVG